MEIQVGNLKHTGKNKKVVTNGNYLKWAQLGTIQRPLDYESSALTS